MNAICGISKALWFMAPGRAEWLDESVPVPGEGEVHVRALFSAISRGTESLVFNGRILPSEYGRMRAPFQTGQFPFPVKYGYAAVGRVESGPADILGKPVFALHPHQTAYTLPHAAVTVLPEGLPPARAVLAANMETALNGVWDSGAAPASKIAVVGAGVLGALIAYLVGQMPGTEVTLIDIQPARSRIAAALGVVFATPDQAPEDCDLVFHASASAAGLNTALAAAGNEASVMEMSWYGNAQVPVALGGGFHSRRLRLISSQVGQVADSQRSRWSYARRLSAALSLLQDPRLDVLLEPACPFLQLPDRLPTILGPGSSTLCQVVAY